MVKVGLFATAAVLALGAGVIGAKAADALVEAAPAYSWSGVYIGGQVGYAGGRENDNLSSVLDDFLGVIDDDGGDEGDGGEGDGGEVIADDFRVNGIIGGVYGGVNFQTASNWVFGVEGDFSGSGADGDHDYSTSVFYDPFENEGVYEIDEDGNLSMDNDWQASIRGRVGYAMDRTLLYATGGVAFARVKLHDSGVETQSYCDDILCQTATSFPESYEASDTKTLVGYTIGAGLEHAFTDHWIGRLEGRFTDFGSKTFDLTAYDVEADLKQGQVTVGISYKF